MQLGNLDENSHKQKMVGPNYPRKKSWIDQTSSEEFEHDLWWLEGILYTTGTGIMGGANSVSPPNQGQGHGIPIDFNPSINAQSYPNTNTHSHCPGKVSEQSKLLRKCTVSNVKHSLLPYNSALCIHATTSSCDCEPVGMECGCDAVEVCGYTLHIRSAQRKCALKVPVV